MPRCFPFLLIGFAILLVLREGAGEKDALESVPDLERAMYRTLNGYPCVRLLNLSGQIGCSNPGRDKVVAPIITLSNVYAQVDNPSAVLISINEMESFFLRVSNDINFAQKITGVLIEPKSNRNKSIGFSPDSKFPQAQFAPYIKLNYEWNPNGSGIMWNHYEFPVFLLSDMDASVVQKFANKNGATVYPSGVAEFDLVMQTTKVGTQDSESCLKGRTCLPLGGYSVWSALPPIDVSLHSPKPIILILASQDSASFFRDLSVGADSSISGLIALLAAVDALSYVDGINELQKQIVFMVLNGESWGYLGSRRFLLDLDTGTDAIHGLNSTLIQHVLEIGSVGKGLSDRATTFFAHPGGDSSNAEILKALEHASDSLGSDNIDVKVANPLNPGIPPSSMMAFISKNPSTSGVVLEDFDSSFTNHYYHSHLDSSSNINTSSIAAASVLVARAVFILSTGDMSIDLIALNSIKVNMSLVELLVGCLLTCEPGLSCVLVKEYISAGNLCPNHYVGVFLDVPSDTQRPEYADDTSRFIWNFMADKTSLRNENASSCSGECGSSSEVCVGAETLSGGKCKTASTRYVPAYSTRLKFENDSWHVIPASASDPLSFVDPVWTESFWNSVGLRVYKVQGPAYNRLVLLSGLGVTLSAYGALVVARLYLSKAMKHD